MYKTLLGMANGGFVPTESSSTKVHSNIDNLILQSELDKFAQTGWMSEDRTPEYIGGTDDVVANVAMSPLLAAKKIPSLLKAIKDMGLKNPLYHFTTAPKASGIIKSGTIKGKEQAFPGKPFKEELVDKEIRELYYNNKFLQQYPPQRSPAVSVTRDPKFTSRPHKHVGTDVRFIMDRDEMIKKGLKIEPFTEPRYRKTSGSGREIFFKGNPKSEGWLANMEDLWGEYGGLKELKKHGLDIQHIPKKPNPMFEFEERVRGNIPTENIKLIDLLKFPKWAMEEEVPGMALRKADFLHDVLRKEIPIMMSQEARSGIKQLGGRELLTSREFDKLMSAPTYTYNPFKLR